MGRLFIITWPNLARLEGCLLFVALVMICAQWITLSSTFGQLLAAEAHDLGVPEALLFWIILGLIVSAPYLAAMVMVDRLLKVRKGLALLSILAVLVWALVGAGLSADVAHLLSLDSIPAAFAWQVALLAAFASTLIHGPSAWTSLSGRGLAGQQPPDQPPPTEPAVGGNRPCADNESPHVIPNPRDRDLRPPVQRGANWLTWASIIASVALGYTVFYRNLDGAIQQRDDPDTLPRVVTPPRERAGLPWPDPPSPLPRVVTLAGESPPFGSRRPQDASISPAPAPLPKVVTSGGEASAARRKDGHFAFSATVNGQPTAMLFDTGASVVAIRAEDAERFGLPVNALKFSVKVLTANGTAMGAAATIDTLTVGNITQHRVPAVVASPGALNENLLGQSFLRNLRQVNVENNRVTLTAD